MLTVKKFEPFCIKTDFENIYVLLEQEHFTISIENEIYHFTPERSKEFVINRFTKKIENLDATFAFKKDEAIFYISMSELINIPDVLIKLYFITKPHFDDMKVMNINDDIDVIMDELEHLNVKRLIDKALDERNEEAFYDLIALL
jgi:hypothetical protein